MSNNIECYKEACGEAVGLLTTYRCNLKCKYCYIPTKCDKDMTLEMAQYILEPFLLKKGGRLDIAFMGGETLMAMSMIRPLVEWILCGNWKRSFRLFGSTNGTLLTTELKIWLKEHSDILTLGLSFDGLPSAQYINRGNLNIDIDFFIDTWPRQPIQMTVNADTVSQMADGVIFLLEKGAKVHPNVAYEKKEWPNEKIREYGKQLNKLIYYYKYHNDKPLISQFIHDLNEYAYNIDHPKTQTQICGAGYGFQVFDIDGESYPCHILSPLVLRNEKLENVRLGLLNVEKDFSANSECETCPYILTCPTCIACNYLYRNGLQNRDRTHCEIMKMEVKAFMKKETIRLSEKQLLTSEDALEIDSIRKLLNYQQIIKHSQY